MTESIDVLFVCTGNTCRSAVAHYYAYHLLAGTKQGQLTIESAGLDAHPGQPMNPLAIKLLAAQGYDTALERRHRSKLLIVEMLSRARTVYGMDSGHVERLEAIVNDKVRSVDESMPCIEMLCNASIPDPYTYTEEAWPPIMEVLQRGVEERLQELMQ